MKDQILLKSLEKFYSDGDNFLIMKNIVTGKSELSLRVIDWFVTNFCKKNNVFVQREINQLPIISNVYMDYRAQLKAYSKTLFDPFRRRTRISFSVDESEPPLETTVGQLNFFRWAIENNVIQQIMTHLENIEEDMIVSQKQSEFTRATPKKKRNSLSTSKCNNISQNYGQRIVQFD
jgi:hypothetical protein